LSQIFLSELPENKVAVIEDILHKGSMRRRLMDLGFIKGEEVTCTLTAAFGGMRAYTIRGSVIALRQEDGRLISVRKVSL